MIEIDITNYIEKTLPILKDRLYPIFTTDTKNLSVVYEFSPISGGNNKQTQLQLRIIHQDYDKCKEIEQDLMKILDMTEDSSFIKFNESYFYSKIAGGGTLFNHGCQMFEASILFIITWR